MQVSRSVFQPRRALLVLAGVLIAALAVLGGVRGAAAAPAPAAASAVPSERAHPGVRPAVSCGYYSGTATTQYGDTGNRVREVQCLLVYWGYSVGSSGIDGIFGKDTRAAVEAFQGDTYSICGPPGLTKDGIVGVHTWSALRSSTSCPTA
jgi:peptidoglycan hydrolase-like protein with peptidoglycan-binding domain